MVRGIALSFGVLAVMIAGVRMASAQPPSVPGRRLLKPGATEKPAVSVPRAEEERAPMSGVPRLRIGFWGGWGGASLSQVEDDTEAHLKAIHLGTTEYFSMADLAKGTAYAPGTPVEREYRSSAAGLNMGVEAGFLVTQSVMVETAGGRPRDVWLGARFGILRPGDVLGSFSSFGPYGGASAFSSTETSLTTLLFGGWFQGGRIAGLHGRVSMFAGPAFASATVRERGVIVYSLTGQEGGWSHTHKYSGRTLAFATGLELAYSITRSLAVFVEGEYHWARFKSMREGGRTAERAGGLAAVYDFTGASVNGGLKVSIWGEPGGGRAR